MSAATTMPLTDMLCPYDAFTLPLPQPPSRNLCFATAMTLLRTLPPHCPMPLHAQCHHEKAFYKAATCCETPHCHRDATAMQPQCHSAALPRCSTLNANCTTYYIAAKAMPPLHERCHNDANYRDAPGSPARCNCHNHCYDRCQRIAQCHNMCTHAQ
jgi:hypothetical protein